jgi:branched-chain amino acid transport system substrate-binding protein
MNKKWHVPLGLLLMGTIVAACGGSSGGTGTGSTSAPGITKDQILIGSTFALSGPVAAAGQAADGARAAVAQVNAEGGINGRKVKLLVENDQYDPTITVQQVKKLVGQDKVFALCCSVGTANQLATRDYLTQQKVPSLFLYTGAKDFAAQFSKYPYSISGVASYPTTGLAFGKYLAGVKPNAKVAVLMQNDAVGKDHLAGFQQTIQGTGIKIVSTQAFEVSIPTTAPLVDKLKQSGADTLFIISSPQGAAQAVKELKVLNWHPELLVAGTGITSALFSTAGSAATGLVTENWAKLPTMTQFSSDPEVLTYLKYMKEVAPKTAATGRLPINGYINMQMMIAALKGMKEPTREALMQSALNLDTTVPMLLPGIQVKTSSSDSSPIETLQMLKWDGTSFQLAGTPVDTSGG